MSATSSENVLDFICNLNALIGVHQHPVDQQLGQLGGQRVRIENRFGRFPAAVLPCLLVLLLLCLCQYCGIGVFVIRKPPARLGSSGKAMPMGLEKKNSF